MEEINNFQIPKLFCSQNNEAQQICSSKSCKYCSLICSKKQCECRRQYHKQCPKYDLDFILQTIIKKKKTIPQNIKKSYRLIQKILNQMLQELSQLKYKIQRKLQMFGLSDSQADFLSQINNNHTSDIKGQLIAKIVQDFQKPQSNQSSVNQDDVNIFWSQRKPDFNNLYGCLKSLIDCRSALSFSMNSKIASDTQLLNSMIQQSMNKKVKTCELLYRATQQNFSVQTFHNKCDQIPNTLILILTQFGKIIGGFTPLQWSKSNSRFQKDKTGKTFIFSLSLRQKYCIISQQATALHYDFKCGPSFGGGCDIQICDQANINSFSYAYFPSAFNNGKYVNSQQSYKSLTGQSQGKNFKVKQWQVYKIKFWDSYIDVKN